MRNLFPIVFLFLSSALTGCYLSHELPIHVTLTPDSGPIVGDAGPMAMTPDAGPIISDSGPVILADAGSDAFIPMEDAGPIAMDAGSDGGSDAGFDAFIPFPGDAGVGRIIVSETGEYYRDARPVVAQPGYRNWMDQRQLCNSADEEVSFSSLDLGFRDPVSRVQNVTLESGGLVYGRLAGAPGPSPVTLALDMPLTIPAHGCVIFDLMAEIMGMQSWAAEPSADGTTHSGDVAVIVWWGSCVDETLCNYRGEAHGVRSGLPYLLVGDDPLMTHGGLYLPVRASIVVIETSTVENTVTDPSDIEAIAFNATALGATGGFLRGAVVIEVSGPDITDTWLTMDGRRVPSDEVTIDVIPFGIYGRLCIFTLREERVLEVTSGARSATLHLGMHVSLSHPFGWVQGRLIDSDTPDPSLPFGEPITGTLTDMDVTYMTTQGLITIPAPTITRSFGPYVGAVVGTQWLISDHSEPDHSLTSRDWGSGHMQVAIYETTLSRFR